MVSQKGPIDSVTRPELPALDVTRKTGDEAFRRRGKAPSANLLGFWQWSSSDLVGNALRGKLAEYIVALAVGSSGGTRIEWDDFDVVTPKGFRVEVKSSAYIQSWKQRKLSSICFDVRQTQGWNLDENARSSDRRRQSDIYVFCVLSHTVQETLDPLNLDQWDFYIIRTQVLDAAIGAQKTISLSRLLKLEPEQVPFDDISDAIDRQIDRRQHE